MIALELKNIKHAAFASEETHCYSATLYVNGKKAAEVSNQGHGGPDMVRWFDPSAEKLVDAHFKAQPKIPTEYDFDLDPCLEIWCGDAVNEWLTEKNIKRQLSRSVLGVHDGKLYAFKAKPADLPRARPALLAKYPGMVILQDVADKAEQKRLYLAHVGSK